MSTRPKRNDEPSLPLFPAPPEPAVFSVTQLTGFIRNILTVNLPPTLHVVGQISNYKLHGSGHLYFTLKDDNSEISCVMWRTAVQYLKFKPSDGLEVLVTAAIDVYERSGRYQLYVRKIEPRGVGALELAFRQLHARLAAEGLFDPTRKRPVAAFPRRLAVITSPTGAVVHDIVTSLKRRFPLAEVLLVPVAVQGEGAAAELTQAVQKVNLWAESVGGVDTIIIGRGGGSMEDLWAFNDEQLARAIYNSRVPVIAAVGHETDVTICELVADVRAATPTAAAELAVPATRAVLTIIQAHADTLGRRLGHVLTLSSTRLTGVTQRSWYADPFMTVMRRAQRVEDAAQKMVVTGARRRARLLDQLHFFERRLQAIEPASLAARKWGRLLDLNHRIQLAVERQQTVRLRRLQSARHRLERIDMFERIHRRADRIAFVRQHLAQMMAHRFQQAANVLDARRARLEALSHHGVLRRGFTLTRDLKTGKLIRNAAQVQPGDLVETETAEGRFASRVMESGDGRERS